jgi:hypothetical protein
MPECEFNLHSVQQMDFDVRERDCGGTWAAPLWITPHFWAGGGQSGEIDMVENCPADAVWSNFAGGQNQVRWSFADPNSLSAHVTLRISNGDVTVKMCPDNQLQSDGTCPPGGEASYGNIYGANGCAQGDCIYRFVSDIWNGNYGDDGYKGCTLGNQPHLDGACAISIRNIKVQQNGGGGIFSGKCQAMNSFAQAVQFV